MDTNRISESIQLAESWQQLAQQRVSRFDRKFHRKMQKLLEHPQDKVLLMQLMDQCFRSSNSARVARQIQFLLSHHGMAHFFSAMDRFLLRCFQHMGMWAPSISVPLFVRQIREDSRTVVIKGESRAFHQHLSQRRRSNTQCIVNLIGEMVLGETEAQQRLQTYASALEDPQIDYLSIKLSTLYSQMNSLDMEGTVRVLTERLSKLFRVALQHRTQEGRNPFINLDMEEYRDLEITVRVFEATLDQPEFQSLHAGLALQAYLPDSFTWQQQLTQWAMQRVSNGGAPIKIRLVKGANMEMESTEAALRGWPIATFREKLDTDANYRRMLAYALSPEHAAAAHIGTASHNLFEQAWAVTLAKQLGSEAYHSIEMLEGMSESARLAIRDLTQPVLLYAPCAKREQFTNAIAYLVRRLDENTGHDHFIRYSFGLKLGSDAWESQKQAFLAAFERVDRLRTQPFRRQNRLKDPCDSSTGTLSLDGCFRSEADTDFTLPANREWAAQIRQRWKKTTADPINSLPVVVAGVSHFSNRKRHRVKDRSDSFDGIPIAEAALANIEDIALAVNSARSDPDAWRTRSASERCDALRAVARKVREHRGDLIGVAAAELGKAFTETDVEVSEAVDFLEYYAHSAERWYAHPGVEVQPQGVGVVVSPWNFPIAIPLGGVAAALAAGNTVILKPASSAIYCAHQICQCFWEAGISQNTLQLLPCSGSLAGQHLISNPDVDFVILTGGESTAQQMLHTRPDLLLAAETGGKDATIVTAMADRDQAIRNVIHSAFSNSGQKCSATSLLILEREVYEDAGFRDALVDAAMSLNVGSPWDFKNRLTLLESEASGALRHALDTLEPEESWALPPSWVDDHALKLKPCIKWGVKQGSFCHRTELFGPLLSVMCADNLTHAIELVNATGYGLTSGLESLDEREIQQWKQCIHAGNLYVNRSTTGAIVLRQPFGGLGKSAVGAGRKVGTHNYLSQFMRFRDRESTASIQPISKADQDNTDTSGIAFLQPNTFLLAPFFHPGQVDKLRRAAKSYAVALHTEFSRTHDAFRIRGEHNAFRYLPTRRICIRAEQGFDPLNLWLRILGVATSGVDFDVRFEGETEWLEHLRGMRNHFPKLSSIEVTPDAPLIHYLAEYSRLLYCNPANIPPEIFEGASRTSIFIPRQPPLLDGRLELLHSYEEQVISHSYHRYGNTAAAGK
ncbi:MAG: bifunctional proline dehydrogenase/L-glutamate gamma-semialdehyde dehydrogenase [Puniceicoccaceae bacterium]